MADSVLNLTSKAVAYSDSTSSTPERNNFSWSRPVSGLQVKNPQNVPYSIAVGESRTVFDGTRSTGVASDTEFTMSLSPLSVYGQPSRYRFTHSDGTAPAFRVDRGLTLDGQDVEVEVNSNATVTVSSDAGSFSAVQVGDIVFIPSDQSGDVVSPFSLNVGYWVALGKSGDGSEVYLARQDAEDFEAVAETVTLTDDSQVQAFSASGVQIGDRVNVCNGFSSAVQRTYEVVAVNPAWFEVVTSAPLPPSEVAVPTASGILFYTSAKRYVRVEYDQECVVRVNGDTTNKNTCEPWEAGDDARVGEFTKVGTTWSLVVVNRSTESALNVTVLSVE